ncbi:reverse transcriptase domain-containing protein [Tanacetum coccineum]
MIVPTPGEELILYLAATHEAISYVLMTERDRIQKSIYFLSKALQGPEVNYPDLEKLALALVLIKPENSGRLAKWSIELAESTINGVQDIASSIPQPPTSLTSHTWTLYTDGASSNDGSEACLILTDPHRNEVTYALRFEFPIFNNEAEYEALIAGLELATRLEVTHLQVFSDSLLITNHVKGTYDAREDSMKRYLAKTQRLLENSKSFSITQIPRSKNKREDALSKLASSFFAHLTRIFLVEVKKYRNIYAKEVRSAIEIGTTWMDPIVEYLKDRKLPANPVFERKNRIKCHPYSIKDGNQYKKGYVAPWLRCIGPHQAEYVLQEAHFGSCRSHSGARTLAQKAARLVGPFPEAPGRLKFLLVAVDYFTKWVEAEPLATICGKNILKFVWKNILCHFNILDIIVSETGKQFAKNPFHDWCQELHIQQKFTSVVHLQANGQTEVTNSTIVQGLKTRLSNAKGLWVEELPNVLWAY